MYTVHIYAETDNSAPAPRERKGGYVLECVTRSGKTVTVEEFSTETGTYHAAILNLLCRAFERINQSCEVHIHTKDAYVLEMVDKHLEIWAGNGFLSQKGEPIKNQTAWSRLWQVTSRHLVVTEQGTHPYYNWMIAEMQRR